MNALGVMPAENFVAQCRAENANYSVDGCGDEGDLNTARPGEVGKAGVVVGADWIGRDFFGGILRGIGGWGGVGGGRGHGLWMRLLRRRRDV